jgi:hypothetical protein
MKRLILFAVLLEPACHRPQGNSRYSFESEPRAVLAGSGAASSGHPQVAVTSSGSIYLLALEAPGGGDEQLGLSLWQSSDGGDNFAGPVLLPESRARVSSHGENSPRLLVTPTEIYVLWEQRAETGATRVVLSRSLDFGRSFERPVPVADKRERSFNGFATLAARPDGTVYAVWLDGRDVPELPGTFSLYLARSNDRGGNFGENIRIAGRACPCCRPALGFGREGELVVAWRKVFDQDVRDMVVSFSRDGGVSFEEPVRVAHDNWRIDGCPESGPALALAGGRLFLAWYTEPSGARPGVRLAWSDDGGKSFEPAIHVAEEVLDANHPMLAISQGETILLTFQGRNPAKQDGWSALQPYWVEIEPSGSVSPPFPLSSRNGSASYPVLATGTAGRTFVAWTETTSEGRREVVLVRGRAALPRRS